MEHDLLIKILLSIVGSAGLIIARQSMKIADSVKSIHSDLNVLTNDHINLKKDVNKVEGRVEKLEARHV